MDINNLKKMYIKKISKNIETIDKQFTLLNKLDLQLINDNLQHGGNTDIINKIDTNYKNVTSLIDKIQTPNSSSTS